MEIVIHNLEHRLMITAFVFVMMMLVDYINVLTAGRLTTLLRGSKLHQLLPRMAMVFCSCFLIA